MKNSWFKFFAALFGVAAVTTVLFPFNAHLSAATVALAFLLIVLFTAAAFGRNPALLASFVGMLCFNFFFLPPFYTFTIAERENWVALVAFVVTAVVAGELSERARQRAFEAKRGQAEIERLYQQLQTAFEQSSRAEALRQSEQLKSALLDAVTHDLRTPLTSIKAAITTLIEDEQKQSEVELNHDDKGEFLAVINEETDRLNKFIEAMVELAKIEAGAMSLRQTWSEPAEIIAAAVERAKNLLKNHKVELRVEKDLPLVRADAKAVAEVVYTLLDNAAKYSPENSPIIIAAQRGELEMIEIGVTDVGRGIAPEMRTRVFDKFFRAGLNDKEQANVGGLGLGLAIARGIVEAHGGQIQIADAPDDKRGTKIIFTLPIGDEA